MKGQILLPDMTCIYIYKERIGISSKEFEVRDGRQSLIPASTPSISNEMMCVSIHTSCKCNTISALQEKTIMPKVIHAVSCIVRLPKPYSIRDISSASLVVHPYTSVKMYSDPSVLGW